MVGPTTHIMTIDGGEMMEWKHIDSAPKDGTRFLAIDKNGAMGVIWWSETDMMWEDVECLIDDDGSLTHWMELPNQPANNEG